MQLNWLLLFISWIVVIINISGQKKELHCEISNLGIFSYTVDGLKVDKDIFYQSISKNDPAYQMFKKGKKNIIFGHGGSYIGGFLIGYSLADIMINKKKNYVPGAIGAGLMVISIPLSKNGKTKINSALEKYKNEPLTQIPTKETRFLNADLEKSCMIVRYPAYSSKLNYLKKLLASESLSAKNKVNILQNLNEIVAENQAHLNVLTSGFNEFFELKNVYFMPDSMYKPYVKGEKTVFVNQEGVLDPSLQCSNDNQYFFIQGKDKDQLLFVDKNLQKMSSRFPYRKKSFLPSFNKIFNKEKYIKDQISFFNNKIMRLVFPNIQ